MIAEEKVPKVDGRLMAFMNQRGLKIGQVDIRDWNQQYYLVLFDSDDVAGMGTPTPLHRGPGRPPNPPKEAA